MDSINVFERVIPDHSILELHFVHNFNATNSDNVNVQQNNNDINKGIIQQNNASNIADECAARYFKRYKIRNMPVNFLESDIACQAMIHCMENIEHAQAMQHEIDDMYENICNVDYNEMNLWFKSHNVNSVARKRIRHRAKLFWNDELFYLWTNYVKLKQISLAVNNFLKLEDLCWQLLNMNKILLINHTNELSTNLSVINELTLRV